MEEKEKQTTNMRRKTSRRRIQGTKKLAQAKSIENILTNKQNRW